MSVKGLGTNDKVPTNDKRLSRQRDKIKFVDVRCEQNLPHKECQQCPQMIT